MQAQFSNRQHCAASREQAPEEGTSRCLRTRHDVHAHAHTCSRYGWFPESRSGLHFVWHLVWTEGVQIMAGPAHVRGASVPHAILAHVGGLVEDEVVLPTEVHVGFLAWRRHRPQAALCTQGLANPHLTPEMRFDQFQCAMKDLFSISLEAP